MWVHQRAAIWDEVAALVADTIAWVFFEWSAGVLTAFQGWFGLCFVGFPFDWWSFFGLLSAR